jgi:type IV secretory pathway VirJ component
MKKITLLTIVFAIILISVSRAGSTPDTLSVAMFGKVYIYKQSDTPRNVVILISGDGGWKFGVVGFAETFSDKNNLVIGVDILKYYKDLRQRTDSCYNVAADFVQLATGIEKKYNFPDYKPPVIMGYSSGATLVYAVLSQARPETFIGGISLGFCADIELPKMLCQINGLTETVDVPGKKYFLQPDPNLGNPWIVLHGKIDKVCNYSDVVDFVNKTRDAELVTLPNVGHGFSKWPNFMPQWKDALNRLIAKYEKIQPVEDNFSQAKNLPVVITNSKIQNKDAAVVLLISGDGGWYGFEQSIADHLAAYGFPTVGLDSKKYFWKRRSPEETAGDMSGILNYYGKEWGIDRFVIIGYSLGAELVPFIVNRFPEQMRSKIVSTVLLSPASTTDFEIHISNMLGIGNRQNTYNVTEEIIKMQSIHTLCIFGENEKTTIQGLLKGTSVKIRLVPGDHHYKFNLPLIIQTMKDNKAF